MTWQEAYAFCIWDGGFLPSEAEWEYVAAGGSDQREYPWGNTQPGTACPGTGCQYAIYGCDYPSGSGTCTNASNIAPVGTATLGAARWGHLDMAGEVWQWTLDAYASYADPCGDCAYLSGQSNQVIRGGRYDYAATYLVAFRRGMGGPEFRESYFGFRCARTP